MITITVSVCKIQPQQPDESQDGGRPLHQYCGPLDSAYTYDDTNLLYAKVCVVYDLYLTLGSSLIAVALNDYFMTLLCEFSADVCNN